ncbi:MAG: prepilin-type N-terminal cleavage/methylation domain-containing protein, partial [Fimbriimonas ginsengisoli]|nr:prepilin-type N-terminal cleavage/methylation domain-containing protein [Fimbriimonas ginsengisoli]
MSSASRLGFTLIEVVVGVVLVGIGMTAALRGLGAMTHSDVVLRERESCQRLAVRKLDELLATGQVGTTPISGDFADWNDTAHAWNLEVIPSGVDNLYTLRL